MVPVVLTCVTLMIVLFLYSLIENRYIKIEHYTVLNNKMDKDKSLRIVQLSDLHRSNYGKNNSKLFDKIKECNPDFIVMTGDMINRDGKYPEELMLFFQNLAECFPCISILGNHEIGFRGYQPESYNEYSQVLQQCGIQILDNETALIQTKAGQIEIYGYTAGMFFYQERKMNYRVELPEPGNESVFSILLSHNPEMIDSFRNNHFSLILSGHLHGGIVRIPGWRGMVSPHFCLFPKYDGGMYSVGDDSIMIVSRGLGSHTIKFRLFNRPEVVCIHVKGSNTDV